MTKVVIYGQPIDLLAFFGTGVTIDDGDAERGPA
jgi:hypothetical protein